MARVQRPDLPERLRRALSLREPGTGSTVSPEIVPVIILDDLTTPAVDEGYPREVFGRVSAGASVGVFSEIFLINPEASRVDLILYEFWCRRPSGGGGIQLRYGQSSALNNLLGTQTQRFNLDLRVPLRPDARVDSRNQAAVIGTNMANLDYVPQNEFVIFPMRFTIPPDYWISLVPQANNNAIEGYFYFIERLRYD